MTPAEFLTALWGNPPPGQILVWMAPSKRSIWFSGIPETIVGIDRMHKIFLDSIDQDIYTGVSIAPKSARLTGYERVTNASSAGIPGLWADIDIADEVHKKANLPPSIEAAQEVLKLMEHPPSITVHSGHGLQCWWLFDRPWMFKDAQERALAAQLAQSWHGQLSYFFQAHNWTLDATHDLARVMRLPGTYNHKRPPLKRVEVIETTDFRWSALPALPVSSPPVPLVEPYQVGSLTLSPDLEPPLDKLTCLLEAIPTFSRSWFGQRTDFKGGDQSPSVYDQSLANWASQAGWSDQEILALLVAHRRRSGQDLKLRADYYQRTIGKARRFGSFTE